jgi:hypothetical protein
MEYQEYISLGFKRIETNDAVELKRTGYAGFILTKKLRNGVFIDVFSGDLLDPKLYLNKKIALSVLFCNYQEKTFWNY